MTRRAVVGRKGADEAGGAIVAGLAPMTRRTAERTIGKKGEAEKRKGPSLATGPLVSW